MKRICYYHVYLSDDLGTWSHMVLEQMKAMEDAGLLSELEKLRVTCVTQLDGREKLFTYMMHSDWNTPAALDIEIDIVTNPWSNDQEMLDNIENEKTITENYTYQKLWSDSFSMNGTDKILYLHTKGITATDNLLRRGNAEKFKLYYYWRQYLTYGVIENWRECIKALETHNIAGINYYDTPSPHFSGSFWWANAAWIWGQPDPAGKDWWKALKTNTKDEWLKNCSDRFRDEMWLCYIDNLMEREAKVFNLKQLPQKFNPAATLLPRIYYDNK